MRSFFRDIRYALRSLRNTPQFTLIAVLTLALGIGANTAIFSLLDHLQFRNIAVHEPHRLVRLEVPGRFAGTFLGGPFCADHPMFRDLEKAPADLFKGVAAIFHSPVSLSVNGATERGKGMLVSGSAFQVFGLKPAAGRLFTEADDQYPGSHPLVVLSHGYWKRRFLSDPAVIGQSILVNARPMTIIGVAPEGFRGVDFSIVPDVFIPMRMKTWVTPSWDALDDPTVRWLQIYARLADGITQQQAEERLQALKTVPFERYIERSPVRDGKFLAQIRERRMVLLPAGSGFSPVQNQTREPLWILMGLVASVLLIACANISGLLIARFLRREKELAIRLAMGAGNGNILRLSVTESLLLAGGGCLLGLALAEWLGRILLASIPENDLVSVIENVVDTRVLLFTVAVSICVALIFSLVPFLSLNLRGMLPALRTGAGNISTGAGGLRLRKLLVAGQIAICLPIMLGAALFLQTFRNLNAQDVGVQVQNIVQFQVDPLLNGYDQPKIHAFFRGLTENLSSVPGVESVALANSGLFTGDENTATMTAPGEEPPQGRLRNVALNRVSPAYFRTVGIPILVGRPFSDFDNGTNKVGVVNEETARRFFGDKNPLGRQMCFGTEQSRNCLEVIGVVKNSKQSEPRQDNQALLYTAYMQASDNGEMMVYLRGSLPPEQLFAAARESVLKLDSNLPIFNMRSLESQLEASLTSERLLSLLTTAFGLLATLLAAIGLYGVLAFLVASRTKEIGVRMALGAEPVRVVMLVFRDVGWMVALGVLVALPLCYLLGTALQSQLYGVEPWDPAAIASASLVMLGAAACAGAIPAAIAARVNPMSALRNE